MCNILATDVCFLSVQENAQLGMMMVTDSDKITNVYCKNKESSCDLIAKIVI
jgi:hypothetical protein